MLQRSRPIACPFTGCRELVSGELGHVSPQVNWPPTPETTNLGRMAGKGRR